MTAPLAEPRIVDQLAIGDLRTRFSEAATARDAEGIAALFIADGQVRMPHIGVVLDGPAQLRSGGARLQELWESFTQISHPGPIRLDGDIATGSCPISEAGILRAGGAHQNIGVYHDRYVRTEEGWRFAERIYELRFVV